MRYLISQHPARLLALTICVTLGVTLGACDRTDSPLEPGVDPTMPAVSQNTASLISASERIAFISYRDPGAPNLVNGNIYKLDPWAKNEVRVTGDFENDYAPSWSWDNKRIASVRYRMDGTVGRNDIWIVNADGTGGRWARAEPSPWTLFDPKWHPDGTRLVVSLWWHTNWYLATLNVSTGDILLIKPLGGGIVGTRPAFNKAGTKIVFVGPNYRTIEQINLDGSGRKILVTSTQPVDRPAYSPDGKKVAYDRGAQPGGGDIFVKNLATGSNKRLTFHGAPDREPTWSPDGSRIAFASERTGKVQIYTLNAATGADVRRITYTTSYERYPAWTH